MRKSNLRKIITSILIFMMVVIQPLSVFANPINLETLKNGSPVLSDTWGEDQVTIADNLAMNLYMSSCVVPFLESYFTAFDTTSDTASSKDRLHFNQDDSRIEPLTAYLMSLQSIHDPDYGSTVPVSEDEVSGYRLYKLDVNNETIDDDPVTFAEFYEHIRVQLLKDKTNVTGVLVPGNGASEYHDVRGDGGGGASHTPAPTHVIASGSTPERDEGQLKLGFKKKIGNQPEQTIVVYDSTDVYCRAQLYTSFQQGRERDVNQVSSIINEYKDNCIVFDPCGNVSIYPLSEEQTNIVLLPAYSNPNINKKHKFNLLGSNTFNSFINNRMELKGSKDAGQLGQESTVEIIWKASTLSWWLNTIFGDFVDGLNQADGTFRLKISPNNLQYEYYDLDTKNQNGLRSAFSKVTANGGDTYSIVWETAQEYANLTATGKANVYNRALYYQYLIQCALTKDIVGDAQPEFNEMDAKYFSSALYEFKPFEYAKGLSREEMEMSILSKTFDMFTSVAGWASILANWLEALSILLYKLTAVVGGATKGGVVTLGFAPLSEWLIIGPMYQWIYNHFDIFFIIVFILGAILAFLSGRVFKNIFKVFVLLLAFALFPMLFNKISVIANEFTNKLFLSAQDRWVLNSQVNWEKMYGAGVVTSEKAKVLNDINYEEPYVKYTQDKSPIILNNISTTNMKALQNTYTGKLFLGAILQQYVEGNQVKSNIGELNKKLTMLLPIWDKTEITSLGQSKLLLGMNYFDSQFSLKAHPKGYLTDTEKGVIFNQYTNLTSAGDDKGRSYTRQISQTVPIMHYAIEDNGVRKYVPANIYQTDDENSDASQGSNTYLAHTNYYLLNGTQLNCSDKYSLDASDSFSEGSVYANKFNATGGHITTFNYYDESPYDSQFGYFINTENVIPYFMMVFWDTFASSKKKDIGYLIQGEVEYTDDTLTTMKTTTNNLGDEVIVRNSIFQTQSKIIDYCDLQELITNMIPYCYHVSKGARELHKDEKIGDDYPIYYENEKSWLYDCNWAIKFMDAYHSDMGATKVFSEYQGVPNTRLEKRIQEFYLKLTPKLENLITKINDDTIKKETLIRYMAVIAGLQFNETFSTPTHKLEPVAIDTGSITIDTLWKDLLEQQYFEVSVDRNAAEDLAQQPGNTIAIFAMCVSTFMIGLVFPAVKTLLLFMFILIFYLSLIRKLFAGDVDLMEYIMMALGVVIFFIKLILLFNIPLLCFVFFANNLGSQQGNILLIAVILGIITWADWKLVLMMMPQHVGLYKDAQGHWKWSRESAIEAATDFGISKTKENLLNFKGAFASAGVLAGIGVWQSWRQGKGLDMAKNAAIKGVDNMTQKVTTPTKDYIKQKTKRPELEHTEKRVKNSGRSKK